MDLCCLIKNTHVCVTCGRGICEDHAHYLFRSQTGHLTERFNEFVHELHDKPLVKKRRCPRCHKYVAFFIVGVPAAMTLCIIARILYEIITSLP